MTEDHRRPQAGTAQGVLLDDAGFLREIVERVLQEVLEAEMTEHVGERLPTNTPTPARAIETAISRGRDVEDDAGGHYSQPTGAPGPGGDLLHQALRPLPTRREGAGVSVDGDVP